MKSIQEITTVMMIFGSVLIALGLIWLPFDRHFRKKHGQLPENLRLTLAITCCLSSVFLTYTIKTIWFSKRTTRYSSDLFSPPSHHSALRNHYAPAPPTKEQEARTLEKARQAEHYRRELEAQRIKEQARSRQARAFYEMRSADVYKPLPEPTSEQAKLSDSIIAANEDLQSLKARKRQQDETRTKAFNDFREANKTTPVDRDRIKELQTQISEAGKASFELSRNISDMRVRINDLLNRQLRLHD